MNIEVKSSSGISLVPMETRLLSQRKIFLEGEINQNAACDFIRKVMFLTQEDEKKRIDVLINSEGGEIVSGLAIYDVIQTSKAPIRMICIGMAYSMGALLFASGNHGRYLLPHSKLMLHEPLITNQISGKASSIKSISDSLLETRKTVNQIIARHTKRTEQEVEEATSYDHYFNAEESISFGLADGVITFDKIF